MAWLKQMSQKAGVCPKKGDGFCLKKIIFVLGCSQFCLPNSNQNPLPMNKNLRYALFFVLALGLAACGGKDKATVDVAIGALVFEGDAAEFGTASLRAKASFNVDSLFKAQDASKVSKGELKFIKLKIDGAPNFDAIASITLQFTAADIKSVNVGSANNIAEGTTELTLELVDAPAIAAFFQAGNFEALIDLNLKDDMAEDKIKLIGNLAATLSLQ